MEKVSLFLPTFNRLEYTKITLENALLMSTPELVKELLIVDGPSKDGTREYLVDRLKGDFPFPARLVTISDRHVVHAMLAAYRELKGKWVAKIDSDTIVPPQWLERCLAIAKKEPEIWAWGVGPLVVGPPFECKKWGKGFQLAKNVGGIGLFRRDAWKGLVPETPPYFGWTARQHKASWGSAWVNPPVLAFTLDLLPFEPWRSLGLQYEEKGWQRAQPLYSPRDAWLWEWKFPEWGP
jgi:glycosyltransferase involved in cell wall biosynthesis